MGWRVVGELGIPGGPVCPCPPPSPTLLCCGLGQVTSPLCLSFLICKMRAVTLVVPTYLPGARWRLLARTCGALSERRRSAS